MNIERALRLKVGDTVACPADRGESAYTGTVVKGAGGEHKNHQGIAYAWISVRGPKRNVAIWPSNRLG